MARHARLVYPEIALHITQRGNNRQDCFYQDNDRLVYLSVLRDTARLRQCAIHAYCLMTNHVHLLVTPPGAEACALFMRDLGRCYAAYFNRRYSRTGSLWERPFKSCLVESAAYVLNCYRYIERNPVRARMVEGPAAHPWSSYAGNAGARSDVLLTAHVEYLALSESADSRYRAYRGLLGVADDPGFLSEMRKATDAGFPLVGEVLKAKLEAEGVRLEADRPGPKADPSTDAAAGQLSLLTE